MERTALVFVFKIYKGFAYIYCIFNVTHGENVSLPVERKLFSFGDKKKWRHGAAQNHRTPALNSDIVDISGHLDRYVSATICCQYHYIYIYISNEPCLSVNLCLFAGFAFEFMVGSKVAMLENCQTSLKSWQRCFLSIRHIYRGNFWTFVHHFLFNYKDYSWLTKAKDYSPITMSHFAILFWTSKNTTLICITLEF